MAGARPTRISTCGMASCPISAATISRLAGTSVMCVSVHVASPAMVASSSTADSISPQRSTSVMRVVVRRQHHDLRVVLVDFEAPFAVVGYRKVAADVDAIAFGSRHQRAVRYTVGNLESCCPPVKFGVIGRVVETKRFGELRGFAPARDAVRRRSRRGAPRRRQRVSRNTGSNDSQSGGAANGSRSVRRIRMAFARRR